MMVLYGLLLPSREPNWINTNPLFTDLGSPGTNGVDQHLPVELTSFTAIGGDGRVSLKWVTQSEIDNQGFYLYRSNDKDGTYNQLSDLIKGAGNSSSQITYTYVDESVFNGITYWYKLIDVDVNGVGRTPGNFCCSRIFLQPIWV